MNDHPSLYFKSMVQISYNLSLFYLQLGNGDHNFNSKQYRSAFVSSSSFFMEIFFYFPFRNVFSLHVNTSANYLQQN